MAKDHGHARTTGQGDEIRAARVDGLGRHLDPPTTGGAGHRGLGRHQDGVGDAMSCQDFQSSQVDTSLGQPHPHWFLAVARAKVVDAPGDEPLLVGRGRERDNGVHERRRDDHTIGSATRRAHLVLQGVLDVGSVGPQPVVQRGAQVETALGERLEERRRAVLVG